MFQGSAPQGAIKVIGNIVKEWDCKRIYVGCSGNFTVERSISSLIDCPVTSNDVTIYSSYIGKFFTGESLDYLKVRDDYDGDCGFMKEYMNSDVEKVATMMLAADVLSYDKSSLAYSKRMLRGYREQFLTMHQKLVNKLNNLKIKVDTFYQGDVMDLLDEIPKDCGFICYPPFFKNGYEKMWKALEGFFEYERPEYKEFSPEESLGLFVEKVKQLDNFVIIVEREVEELQDYYIGQLNLSSSKLIYFYGKTTSKHFIKKNIKDTKAKPLVKISKEDKIEDDIIIKEISLEQFEENRALYLSTAVTKIATPSKSYGLFTKGKCFGIFAIANSFMLTGSDRLEKPTTYLLTDFAVSPTCEKHLSKLVLYCVLSKEARLLMENVMGKRVHSIATNAFSRNPVSMKYRGIFDLYGSKVIEKDKDGKPKKYNLSYGATVGQWTLKEAFKKWKRK